MLVLTLLLSIALILAHFFDKLGPMFIHGSLDFSNVYVMNFFFTFSWSSSYKGSIILEPYYLHVAYTNVLFPIETSL